MPRIARRPRSFTLAGVGVTTALAIASFIGLASGTRPAGEPSPPGAAGGRPSAGVPEAKLDVIPAIDPQPWAAVDWRQVPKAFGPGPRDPLDRIDGLVRGGPGVIGWGRVHQAGRNQFNDMGAVHLSPDGVRWAVVPVDAGVGQPDTSGLRFVADGPAGLVAFGDVCCTAEERPALWRSDGGLAWERLPYPINLAATAELSRLIATEDRYVLVGRMNRVATIWTSVDAMRWTVADGDAAAFGPGIVTDVAPTPVGLVAAGYRDVAGTYDGAVWTSADGEQWTRMPADALTGPDDTIVERIVPWARGWFLIGRKGPHAERVRCEQLALVGHLASNASPRVPDVPRVDLSCGWGTEVHWLTADGVTWQLVEPAGTRGRNAKPGELIEFRLVSAGGPGLVVLGEGSEVGAASIFVSADGIQWQPTAPDDQIGSGLIPSGFVIGGRTIFAVADGPSAWIGTAR